MAEGYELRNGDVKTAAQLVVDDPRRRPARLLPEGRAEAARRHEAPRQPEERSTSAAISRPSRSTTSCSASARPGTGKTYLAMAQAVSYLLAKKVSRIILARPAVEAGEKLGFLPGDLQEKVNPYLRPLYDALYDMMDTEKATRLVERGTIEVAPIAFMRGRTLNDAFVILDEAQNTTSEQMKMFLTRLGFGSKAVVTGDITQIDLPNPRASGLVEALQDRQGRRGHRLHLLRRQGRRPPQARAADREGVRRLLGQPRGQRCGTRKPPRPSAVRVEVVTAGARARARAGALARSRWRRRAPAAR